MPANKKNEQERKGSEMPILSMQSLNISDLIYLTPGFIAAIIGILLFALVIRERVLVGILSLAASVSAMMFFLIFWDVIPTPDRAHEWVQCALALFGFFGSPFLFTGLSAIVGFTPTHKRKLLLLFFCVLGLIASVVHTIVIHKVMRGMP